MIVACYVPWWQKISASYDRRAINRNVTPYSMTAIILTNHMKYTTPFAWYYIRLAFTALLGRHQSVSWRPLLFVLYCAFLCSLAEKRLYHLDKLTGSISEIDIASIISWNTMVQSASWAKMAETYMRASPIKRTDKCISETKWQYARRRAHSLIMCVPVVIRGHFHR